MKYYYNSHYTAYAEMLGKPNVYATFEFLLDLYAEQSPANNIISVSAMDVVKYRGISKNTVQLVISTLESAGLITSLKSPNGRMSKCEIHIERYVSLINCFVRLQNSKDKRRFTEALLSGNENALEELGFKIYDDAKEQFGKAKGKKLPILGHLPEAPNFGTFAEDEDKTPKFGSLDEIHFTKLPKLGVSTFENGQFWEFLISEGIKKVGKEQLKESVLITNSQIWEFYKEEASIDDFFSDPMSFFERFPQFKTPIFGTLMSHFWEFYVPNLGVSRGIYNNIIINNNIRGNLPVEKQAFTLKADFSDELVDKEQLAHTLSSYKQIKRKSRLPFFPVNEIESYVSDIRNCLDRADKIFINQVWEIAHELYDKEDTLDENGDVVLPGNTNLEGVGVEKERIKKDLLFPAFDKTQEIVEKGTLTINGEVYPVTATINDPNDFDNIVDWELITLLDGSNYIISSSRFRNIYAEEMEIKPKNIRVHVGKLREDDKAYMQKIVLIGDDDERYNELTAIELVIYNFLNEHFHINLSGEVEEPKTPFVNRAALGVFYLDIAQKGLTTQDFLSVLFNDKPEYGTGSLNLRQRMFSADKIRQWNTLHSCKSIIDDLTVDNLLANKAPTEAD